MKNIVISKCGKDYELIKINASSLDKYFGGANEEQQERSMELGSIFHDIILSCLYSKNKTQYIYQYHAPDIRKSEQKWIRSCIEASKSMPEFILIEQKKRITIELGEYKVLFTCKFDGMYIDGYNEGNNIFARPVIVDVKSSAHKRTTREDKLQVKSYAFVNGVSKVEYWIYPKQGFDGIQVIPFILNPKKNQIEVINAIILYLKDNYQYQGKFLSIEN